MLRFLQVLSQLYQGLEPSHPPPTFEKYEFPHPTLDMIEKYLPLMPHLAKTCNTQELGSRYAELNESTASINWRIEKHQLQMLHTKLVKGLDPAFKLSEQDCLTAYIVSVLNRCVEVPIRTVTNAASASSPLM